MKRFIIFLSLLWSTCFSAYSQASITDVHFSTAQVFDVQWYVSGSTLYTSGFNYLYSSVNYSTQTLSAARLTSSQYADINSNNRYIAFYNSPTVQGTYGLAVFNSNGTIYKVLNYTGTFRALADGAIFYNGNGMWGTLFTTNAGYSLGQSANFTIIQNNPTNTYMASWTPTNTAPLAAGQTAQTAPSGPTVEGGTITQTNAPTTQILGSGSSYVAPTDANTKQTRINTWTNNNQSHNNELYIEQTYGTNNIVSITQTGDKNRIDFTLGGNNNYVNSTQTGRNYLKEEVPGWGNNITTNQNNTVGSNYAETKIQGNGNAVNHTQTGNGNQVLFNKITGDINTVTTNQSGSAGHVADITLTGNFNSATVTQSGSTANKANINLTNAGGPASVDLQQTGGKSFTIIQSCANPAGCGTVVRQ